MTIIVSICGLKWNRWIVFTRESSLHEDTYINSQNGKEYPCFMLAKRECLGLAARYDVNLQMAIIDRWAELEYAALQNQYADNQHQQSTPRMRAINAWQDETLVVNNILDKLGYSQGFLRKEALEIGCRIEKESGEEFLPKCLLEDPQAISPDTELSPFTGSHAALVAMGTTGSTVSHIAKLYNGLSSSDINNILCDKGYQTKLRACQYMPTRKGERLCNQRILSTGKHAGTAIVSNWLYNDTKILRDDIDSAAKALQQIKFVKNTNKK